MHKQELTVTIGIPALNEGKNIFNLVNSILQQSAGTYTLEKIIILPNGSADNSLEIIEGLHKSDNRIILAKTHSGITKAEKLNQLFELAQSKIIICFDADISLGNKHVIEKLMRHFNDEKVGLVGAGDRPFAPSGFWEKVFVSSTGLWYEVRKNINNGRTIHNIHGCSFALRRKLAHKIKLPANIVADDDYIYFRSREEGYQFSFAYDSVVFYKIPGNLKDYLSQSLRFLNIKNQIFEIFGEKTKKEYEVPMGIKIKALLSALLNNPFYFVFALLLQLLLRVCLTKYNPDYKSGGWSIVTSTKIL
jgi:cellulose synthase/poly-beta-1,6-N-acetylglucosamine synthase-like glycosyltransferase